MILQRLNTPYLIHLLSKYLVKLTVMIVNSIHVGKEGYLEK